ncbi:MAG TPA: FliA/WhiG family RNA polymerase sigma factor [Bryobacteraceae bacterium]|nr:FliA/WhiG family RNA polymerase sigma factor [Bryobacteraceae bacterium]
MTATASKRAELPATKAHQISDRDALIVEHMPLVSAIAAHVQRSLPVHIELDDLIHAGIMGLFDAAVKYESDKQVAFSTYAKHRIRGAVLDSLRQMDWASRDLRKRYKQMEAVKTELTAKLQRDPTHAEIAEAMGLDARRWRALMVDFRRLTNAAARVRPEREDQPQQEMPCAPSNNPDQVFARRELRARLLSAIATLPPRYRKVVELYYDNEMTMKEIGEVMGVNESRVSQIHKSALERMHSALGGHGIQSAAAF